METQQFHLKWNNHSLNTLSSFQHLLDTNTLVDVSLTCSNGKTVTAHRMVLAACSDYFYRLFKDLPEKHPVIVFKDAGEEIVRDLLLFMYRGEVEVQEAYLNDFLKFADTLQVKGLSQSDREEQAKNNNNNNNNNSIRKESVVTPLSLVKTGITPPACTTSSSTPSSVPATPTSLPAQPPMSDLAKSYLAGLSKFPPIFPHMPEPMGMGGANPPDLFGGLGSPNLYRALQKKYPDNPVLFKQMPFLKKMFGDNPDLAAAFYPQGGAGPNDDSESGGDRATPPLSSSVRGLNDENGLERPQGADSPYPPSNTGSLSGDGNSPDKKGEEGRGGSKNSGRGSRLERMIAAEYKIMSEFPSDHTPEMLPVMTPELMKSRRTHSLQLAIAEIMHNRASVQSAATKYHIPRETLRRHYQRYLKAMGIQKRTEPNQRGAGGSGSTTPTSSTPSNNTSSNNNNSKGGLTSLPPSSVSQSPLSGFAAAVASMAAASNMGGEEGSNGNGFSSLMDIGAAYGIWNPEADSEFKAKRAKLEKEQMQSMGSKTPAEMMAEKDDKEKLVIDEDEDDEEEEPLSPGGPEDQPSAISTVDSEAVMDNEQQQSTKPSTTSTSTPMETSA